MIGEQLREEPRPHSPGHDGGHTNAKNTGSGRRSFFHLMMGSLEMRQSGLQARIKYPSDRRRLYAGGASFEHLLTERSEEHTSELQSLMRNSYAVFCLKKIQKTQATH